MASAVAVDGITKRYGPLEAVSELSFSVDAGSVFALLGPNGAGKTTTVEVLEGYRDLDAGSVSVLGLDPIAEAAALKPRMGLMLQSGGIYQGARAHEVLHLFAALYPDADDPDRLLDLVGLSNAARTTFRRLSGGQQRRLALAIALVGRPEIVFLDEPTAGMDPKARQLTYGIIRDLRDDGVTVLLTTHLLDEAENLADQVAIIDRGRMVAHGTPAELMAAGDGIRFGAPDDLDVSSPPETLGVIERTRPGHFLVHCEPTPERVAVLTAWAAERNVLLTYVNSGSRSLEDVFLETVE